MRTLTNSEDPDEMLHNFAFHLGLQVYCLMIQKLSSETKYNTNWKLQTDGPSQVDCIGKSEGRIH